MEPHPLDRPVWNSLRGRLSHLAQGYGGVLRIDPDYGPFAAAEPGAEADFARCLRSPEDEIWIVEPAEVAPLPGLRVIRTAPLLQMIADGPLPAFAGDDDLVPLGEEDVPEMTALALATQPGPWGPRTCHYGQFHGIRREGRLAAMAGERFRPAPGLGEVSGVCTWPQFQGQGMAGRLIRRVMAGLAVRGDVPFLHSYAGNAPAIRLYESLGFRARRAMVVTVLGMAE